MNFDWILEIKDSKTHIENCLKKYDDLTELNEILHNKSGDEALVNIYYCFLKTAIRFPESPITELRKIYVSQNLDKQVAGMARKLRVDEATVHSWIRDIKGKKKSNGLKSKKDILRDLLD
jgi:hypothetical protein